MTQDVYSSLMEQGNFELKIQELEERNKSYIKKDFTQNDFKQESKKDSKITIYRSQH